MPRTGPRLRWAKLLAQMGMWAAMTAALTLASVSVSRGWTFAAAGGTLAFAVLTLIVNLAAADALPGGRRWGRQRGGAAGLSGRGRDGDNGPAGPPAHPWPALAAVSRLMPPAAGRRWLAEAESLLAEITAARRGAAVRSYLRSAPRLAVMMRARQVLRRAQPGPRRPG